MVSGLVTGFRDPFLLALLRDRLSSMLFPKLYVWIRELLVKPNRPDTVSLQSASAVSAGLHIIPGKFSGPAAKRRPPGDVPPETVRGVLVRWASNVVWFSLNILHTQRVPMAIELSPEIEFQLIKRSTVHYNSLTRQDRNSGITRAPRTRRVMAIRAAFHEFNLDPDHSMVDIFELADEMSLAASSRASTSTPEPVELPGPEEVMVALETLDLDDGQPDAPTNVNPDRSGSGDASQILVQQSAENGNPFSIPEVEEAVELPAGLAGSQSPISISEEVVLDIPVGVAETAEGPDLRNDGATTVMTSTDIGSGTAEAPFEDANAQPEQTQVQRTATPSPEPSPVFNPASAQDQLEAILLASRSRSPPSPVPGITRAASLHHTTPRPVRRPTVSDQHVPVFRDEVARRRLLDDDEISVPDPNREVYRVTILSNHAAEAIAYHATSLLESLILLPLDVMFVRSLARNFLLRQSGHGSPPLATDAAPAMGRMWPLGMRAQMRDLSVPLELQFWGNLLITIGMQGLTNFAVWAVGVQVTLRLGERFGWGKV